MDKAIKPYAESSNYNCALCYVELALPVTHLVGPKIDQNNVTISVVNAGCIAPYIKHKDGEVEWLEVGGMPLGQGFGSELGYRELKTTLAKGDMLIMTSDGVVEANGPGSEIFGFEALQQAISNGPTSSATAMLDYLQKTIFTFTNKTDLHDDLTIIVLKV